LFCLLAYLVDLLPITLLTLTPKQLSSGSRNSHLISARTGIGITPIVGYIPVTSPTIPKILPALPIMVISYGHLMFLPTMGSRNRSFFHKSRCCVHQLFGCLNRYEFWNGTGLSTVTDTNYTSFNNEMASFTGTGNNNTNTRPFL
jgi:hypothetical protein